MTIGELAAAFDAWNSRHRAAATVKFYRQRLRLFLAKFSSRDAASLTSLEIDEYLFAAGEEQSDSTKHHNAVALTTLQSFGLRERLIERRWFERLEKPRMGRRERIPDAGEIARLLKGSSAAFRLIYQALCHSGARPGELVKAQIGDIKPPLPLGEGRGEGGASLVGRAIVLEQHKTARKTGKPRVIPIGKLLARLIREAAGDRQAGPIFLNERGKAWSVCALGAIHRRLRDAAGLDPEIVLYSARHRFGTELLRAKVPIKDVSQMMGHASVTTTELYLHRDVTELGDVQDRLPDVPDPAAGDDPAPKAA